MEVCAITGVMTQMTEKHDLPQTFSNRVLIGDFRGNDRKPSLPSSVTDRARQYVAKIPPSVSGHGGHDQTFQVALALVHGFCLTEAAAWTILCEYNNRCEPPWSERELRHKIASAHNPRRHSKPRGYLISSTIAPKVEPPAPRILGQIKLPEVFLTAPCAIEADALPVPASKKPVDMPIVPSPQDAEAHRIASELLKLHKCGFITGVDDPDTVFFASVIHKFKVTIPRESLIAAPNGIPAIKTPTASL